MQVCNSIDVQTMQLTYTIHEQLLIPNSITFSQASICMCGHAFHLSAIGADHGCNAYSWEIFISLDFEWSFIRGKRRFNWPLVNPPIALPSAHMD